MKAAEALALLSPEALAAIDAMEIPPIPAHILDILVPVIHAINDRIAAEEARQKADTPPKWLNTEEAAARAHRHPITVRRAAVHGDLHGHQSVAKGRWTFATAAVDAWVQGLDQRAQRGGCGCTRLRQKVR